MIEIYADGYIAGAAKSYLDKMFSGYDPIRQVERMSILQYMVDHSGFLESGKVLDFGSGTQPYRHLVKGDYTPHGPTDDIYAHASQTFSSIICNQVIQYIEEPELLLKEFYRILKPKGHLIITFPTNWDEVEDTDLFRFTKSGMSILLIRAGFNKAVFTRRAQFVFGNFKFPLGYGVLVQKC